jgi:hypothetical protein
MDAIFLIDYQNRATYPVLGGADEMGVTEQLLIPEVDIGRRHSVTGVFPVDKLIFLVWSITS